MSAQILRFPAASERLAEDRLGAALACLSAALAEQKRAVAAWREALADLGAGVRATEAGLLHGGRALDAVRRDILTLRERAEDLRAWGERQAASAAP